MLRLLNARQLRGNKCDKPEANPQKVRNDLLQHEIITEDFGGDVLCVDVSAVTGLGSTSSRKPLCCRPNC